MSSMVTFRADHPRSLLQRINFFRFIYPLCFVLLIILLVFLHQRFFKITSVSCQTSDSACPMAVEAVISTNVGQSLLRLNLVQLKKQVLALGLVDTIEIKIKLPGQLILLVTPSTSAYYLNCLFTGPTPSFSYSQATISANIIPPSAELAVFVATNSGNTFQLLSSGVLTQQEFETNYYLILNSIPSKDYLVQVFSWLKALSGAAMKPSSLYFITNQLIIKQIDQPDLVMNVADDPYQKLAALQRLNQAVTINKPKVIDFRYTHPILK